MPVNVLFCSDALIVDGVTSFVFHLSTALSKGGFNVAVLGRWAGKGFQSRLREHGVRVIQCLSPTVGNVWFDRKAREFAPDVIVTDSRRSFPLATRLKTVTGAKVLTFFLDSLEKTDRRGRDVDSLIRYSDAWLSAEPPLLEELDRIKTPFPKFLFRRPLRGLITPSSFPDREPFRVLCFGRISGYKSAGPRALLGEAVQLKKAIPSLEMVFVGGGWRTMKFRLAAMKANLEAKENFVRVVGTQTNPDDWFRWASLVCAGSTSAIEAVLANRPVVVMSGFWMGLLTPDKLEEAFTSYFAERRGTVRVREHPELVAGEVLKVYENWDQSKMEESAAFLRREIGPRFERKNAPDEFRRIMNELGLQSDQGAEE